MNRGRKQLNILSENLLHSEQSRKFLDGSCRSVVQLRSAILGCGTYQPGWQWSEHAGTQTGKPSENHVGYIISGYMIIQAADGHERQIGPGDAFEAGPGHDAWVDGNVPCVALDFAPVLSERNR